MSASELAEISPALHVDLAQVCVQDGVWQDMPDHLAVFDEARLGASDNGRGNLYILLDVSGEIEGRAEVERELIETLRREYVAHTDSITFALSEALRAANAQLFEMNLAVARDARRMTGISAAVLRGNDLYIAQAGPAVVYAEINKNLQRYPAESDWFTADQPLLSPQGNASAPLGVRREFACDLFHLKVTVGDVFVLATRALTQLASSEELLQAFAEGHAESIANFIEDLAAGSDLSVLVAELGTPREVTAEPAPIVESNVTELNSEAQNPSPTPASAIKPELLPQVEQIVPEFSVEVTELEEEIEIEIAPESQPPTQIAKQLGIESSPTSTSASIIAEIETPKNKPLEFQPYEAELPKFKETELSDNTPFENELLEKETPFSPEQRLAQLREERRQRRARQVKNLGRALGGISTLLTTLMGWVGSGVARVTGWVDWERVGARSNRTLNLLFLTAWHVLNLTVRLILPGTTKKSDLTPRRVPKEAVWLKGMAVVLPIIFVALALSSYYQQEISRTRQSAQLTEAAQKSLNSAKEALKDSNQAEARRQLDLAIAKIREAQQLGDSLALRQVFYDAQNLAYELSGITVLNYFYSIFKLPSASADHAEVLTDENDIYILDYAAQRIYRYRINDAATQSNPASGDGVILKATDSVNNVTVDQIRGMTWRAANGEMPAGLVVVTSKALWQYDSNNYSWRVTPVSDAAQWGDIRSIASFRGNIYLLDAPKKQLWKYVADGIDYATRATPYLAANSGADFSSAVDLAIDSDVWVLSTNGTLSRFGSGQRVPFGLAQNVSLKNPTALYTRLDSEWLYVADAGTQRIVQLSKDGQLMRQFKPRIQESQLFNSLRALYVNETKRKFYFINGNTVYLANIP